MGELYSNPFGVKMNYKQELDIEIALERLQIDITKCHLNNKDELFIEIEALPQSKDIIK